LVDDHVELHVGKFRLQSLERLPHLPGGPDRVGVGPALYEQQERLLTVILDESAALLHAHLDGRDLAETNGGASRA